MIKTAVLGVGNMGSKYACLLQDRAIEGMELSAITRIKEPYKSMLEPARMNLILKKNLKLN